MLCLPGSPALSEFRLRKLQQQLAAAGTPVNAISSRYIHLVDAENELGSEQLEVLDNLMTYGPAMPAASVEGQSYYVVPRPGTISPWASKATDIAHNCGLGRIRRIERGIEYRIDSDAEVPEIILLATGSAPPLHTGK